MPLTVDRSHALRTVPELRALVEAIFNARKEDEDDAVEWKGDVDDVGAKRWTVQVARHAIGMGNRDPDSVVTAFEGCGYVVLGVEPGRYWGVGALDPADADNKLARYLGKTGVRCRWDTVNVGGFDVAVVTVEPPKWGDPIRCLEKAYSDTDRSYQMGTVFVRRHGKTEQASPEELRALTRRAGLQRERLDLVVELQLDAPLVVVDVSPESIVKWIEAHRKQAVAAARLRASPPASTNLAVTTLVNRLAETMGAFSQPETRTLAEFEAEYAAWAKRLLEAAPAYVRQRVAASGVPSVKATIINTTERNFMKVAVDLHVLTPGVTLHVAANRQRLALPEQPRAYGPRPMEPIAPLFRNTFPAMISPVASPIMWLDSLDATVLHFSTRDVSPRSTSRLGEVRMLGSRDLVGGTVDVEWSATATNVDGRLSGKHSLAFTSVVLTGADVLDAAQEADANRESGEE